MTDRKRGTREREKKGERAEYIKMSVRAYFSAWLVKPLFSSSLSVSSLWSLSLSVRTTRATKLAEFYREGESEKPVTHK